MMCEGGCGQPGNCQCGQTMPRWVDPLETVGRPIPRLEPDFRAVVYLAGHIGEDNYRKVASTYLLQRKFAILDPFRPDRDFRGREDDHIEEIVNGDLQDIRLSQCVLANFTIPSAGTSMECFYANSIGRTVISFVENGGRVSPWIKHVSLAQKAHPTLADALAEIDSLYLR